MINKYIWPILFLISVVFADASQGNQNNKEPAEEQLVGGERTWLAGGYRYGMPGLANITIFSEKDKTPQYYAGILPFSTNKVVIPLDHAISYGGKSYRFLTVASGGRIFLGDFKDYVLPEDGTDGRSPYVKAISNDIVPVQNATNIPMIWRSFNEHFDEYTVIEIGPFYVSGYTDPLLCQVTFYSDGEIQVQYWNKNRKDAYNSSSSSLVVMNERNYLDHPFVFTGKNRITLNETSNGTIFAGAAIDVFNKGKLREGWITKAFFADGPIFNVTDNEYLEIDFSSGDFPGVVIAYDHARENPVIGSFAKFTLETVPVNNFIEQNNDDIYFWYFEEKAPFVNKTLEAGYPYINSNSQVELSDAAVLAGVSQNCVASSPLYVYPCAYGMSWDKYQGVIDTILAPAIKMQVVAESTNRKVWIKRIAFWPMQPRSIQFKPPVTYKIEYEGRGGYMEVDGLKTPLRILKDADVNAVIHATPGFQISKIEVNGKIAYDEADLTKKQQGFFVEIFNDATLANINFPLINNVLIKATYKICSERKLSEVTPAYEKNEVFLDPSDRSKVLEAYSAKDGFGQVVQVQAPVNTGLYRVAATYLDDAGNTKYAPKSYIVSKDAYSFEPMNCEQCVKNSAAYYNGDTAKSKERVKSYDFPYTETDHRYGENGALVGVSAGIGEASFAIGNSFAKTWRLPIKTDASSEFFDIAKMQNDFSGILNGVDGQFEDEYLNKLKEITDDDLKPETEPDYPYVLTIKLSYDGVYTQEISDAAGNILASWAYHNGEVLVTRNDYNPLTSQLTRSYVEGVIGFTTNYTYDVAGRLISTESHDRGLSETRYDSKNRVRYSRSAAQKAKDNNNNKNFSVFIYDDEDRVVKTGEVRGACSESSFDDLDKALCLNDVYLFSEMVYGKPTKADLMSKTNLLDDALASYIVGKIDGVGPNDVGASISYDGWGNVNTMKMASFDRLGRKKKQWIVNFVENPAPAIEIAYEYTSSGKLKRTVTSEWNPLQKQWNVIAKYLMDYDHFDRIENVYEQNLDDDSKKTHLVFYKYNPVGTLEYVTYYDKNQVVYTKKAYNDIYGRTTKLAYYDKKGNEIYVETLSYQKPLVNRVDALTHVWEGNSVHKSVANETFAYDDQGRLTTFGTDMDGMLGGSYAYDIFGRLTYKAEAGSGYAFAYEDGSYRPSKIVKDGAEIDRALSYDGAGNLWLDGANLASYRVNALGLPDRVRLYHQSIPAGLTLEQVDEGQVFEQEYSVWSFAYDETGTRIYEKEVNKNAPFVGSQITVPGVGVYKHTRTSALTLSRLDLPGGGYRVNGVNGTAMFPVTDAQGNIRGYADHNALRTKYAYYPYGSVEEFSEDAVGDAAADTRRWQSKEFDGSFGKYYFGARYYDPILGLWTSPDPAGQYMNPYTYGGDPVNYVDPTGLWSFGIGFVFGWDSNHGWHYGFGSALDLSDGDGAGWGFNTSYTWNEDGSNSFNIGGGGSFVLEGGFSYSYNTYTGSVFSANVGVCFGSRAFVCGGASTGFSEYWDIHGNYMGRTVYAELQVSAFGGLERASAGKEWGYYGMEGRGLYAGASVAGLHAQISEHGGKNWGFSERLFYGATDEGNDLAEDGVHRKVSRMIWIPELGLLGKFKLGNSVDETNKGLQKYQKDLLIKKSKGTELETALAKDYEKNGGNRISGDMLREVQETLLFPDGFVEVSRGNKSKVSYTQNRNLWGNIEFKTDNGGMTYYSSYNHGYQNPLDHFLLDVFGYWMSN